MDSCHLFNFLFGPKKATTELSKCFTSVVNGNSKSNKRTAADYQHDTCSKGVQKCTNNVNGNQSTNKRQTPPSPLKQLQMKIVNHFTGSSSSSSPSSSSSSSRSAKSVNVVRSTCDENCGTYHATLVHSMIEDELLDDESTQLQVTIVDNPLVSNPLQKQQQQQYDNFLDNQTHKTSQRSVPLISDTNHKVTDLINSTTESNSVVDINNNNNNNNNDYDNKNSIDSNHINRNNSLEITAKPTNRIVPGNQSTVSNSSLSNSTSTKVYNSVVSDKLSEVKAKLRRVSSTSIHNSFVLEGDVTNESLVGKQIDSTTNDEYLQRSAALQETEQAHCNSATDKRNAFVQNLVRSFEVSYNNKTTGEEDVALSPGKELHQQQHYIISKRRQTFDSNSLTSGYTKPVTLVKPLPPKTPPKTNKAKCLNLQLSLNKPLKIQQLFQDEKFLSRFFHKLDPLDRCAAAQVCRLWRKILYADQHYWKDLVSVIDCTQLRREHLVECIMNTLQTAKQKQQQQQQQHLKITDLPVSPTSALSVGQQQNDLQQQQENVAKRCSSSECYQDFDQDDVWRIQELCNRYAQVRRNQSMALTHLDSIQASSGVPVSDSSHQQQQQQTCVNTTSKSSSIPSQISSTLSSVSLSSLLTPLSESSRVDSLKDKLYSSLNDRGFDAICLFGASDDDLEDLVSKFPAGARARIKLVRFNNCCLTNRGLDLFIAAFSGNSSGNSHCFSSLQAAALEELELSGCNDITNSFELKPLVNLKRLIITDCINIADGVAQKLALILPQLRELTIQAYHLTDAFLEYLSTNTDTSRLERLELPNCKELTNQSLITIAKYFSQLQILSVSGSTKISDGGIEILAEQARNLRSLDLSWCTRITDSSLECIACDLGDTLTDLIIDRNINISDVGLGYLATMSKLTLLHIRWCRRITDIGLETLIDSVRTLRYLSLAGLHQITARSLLCLVDTDLLEVELTNCPAVNNDLLLFLSSRMPNCNIIF